MADRSSDPYRTEFYTEKLFNLELSRTARAFEPDERIWDRELHRMFTLLKGHVEALRHFNELRERPWMRGAGGRAGPTAPPPTSEDPLAAPLLSIAVFGTYGSGKSSLLKTFVKEARSPRDRADLNKPDDQDLFSLPVIEPNLRSPDDHFLYSFLANALEEDLKRNRDEQERAEAGSHTLSPVQQAFEKVSEYLQVIDEQPRERTYDPLGLSLERLDRHTSDFRLREALTDLIDSLADNLAGRNPSSVLILPVDDPDMSLDKLRVTLETYRRYLMHPRLVPVFTFTGRLAEELLQVHFAAEVRESERTSMARERSSGAKRQIEHLKITEHLAVQYLVKLFPIRNRILVGYAPSRVQAAKFRTEPYGSVRVIHLLEVASLLLFGHPQWPITPRVRMALRPATLRRQLQVLDALHDARVHYFLNGEGCIRKLPELGDPGQGEGLPEVGAPTWVRIFTSAAWSLLNVHRDVLRELDLHMEELAAWTPRGLRREILRIILAQDPATRNLLIKRWRYRIEDRRGQILSLLAVTVFRPEMPGEELSGEDPDRVRQFVHVRDRQPRTGDPGGEGSGELATFPPQPRRNLLTALRGTLWFLELWFGFYLPQILARANQGEEGPPRETDSEEPLVSVGWNLKSAAAQAISEATRKDEVSTTGMMLLNPTLLRGWLDDVHQNKKQNPLRFYLRRLFLDLWCFYGYKGGKAWAAVSFWRGLGLLGQVLDDHQRLRGGATKQALDAEHAAAKAHYAKQSKRSRGLPPLHPQTQRIITLLRNHLDKALRPGAFRAADQVSYATVRWQDSETRQDENAERVLRALAECLRAWAEQFDDLHLDPLPNHCGGTTEQLLDTWKKSFIRRLHGEYVLGRLWPRFGGTFFEKPETLADLEEVESDQDLSAYVAVRRWKEVLETYFSDVEVLRFEGSGTEPAQVQSFATVIFDECPLFAPWNQRPSRTHQPLTKLLGSAAEEGRFWKDLADKDFGHVQRAPDPLSKAAMERREQDRDALRDRTWKQLRDEARQLAIQGRSKITDKEVLIDAILEARRDEG